MSFLAERRGEKVLREFKLKRLSSSVLCSLMQSGNILERYNVDQAEITICEHQGDCYYIINEPEVTPQEEELYNLLMNGIYYTFRPKEGSDLVKAVEQSFLDLVDELGLKNLPENSLAKMKYYVIRDILGYGVLTPLLRDPRIEDISINGPKIPARVYHRDYPHFDWLTTNLVFEDEQELQALVMMLAHRARRHISTAFPVAEGTLPEKHRITLTFSSEVTPFGSSITIRKFREEPLTICHLVKFGTLSSLMAAYWWFLLENKGSVFIVGEMASGKTSLLNALASLLPPHWKIVTIEDTPELRLPHEGWKPLITRHVYSIAETKTEVRLFDLVKLSLRERAQFIIVGEIRGEEAYVFIQALATGHGGGCTFHGDSIESMVMRLTTPPINAPIHFLPLISSVAITRIIKIPGKKPMRRVVEISEIVGVKSQHEVEYNRVFTWNVEEDKHYPLSAEEVVSRSVKLQAVARMIGWTKELLVKELENRRCFIESLVEKDVLEYSQVVEYVKRYYLEGMQCLKNP